VKTLEHNAINRSLAQMGYQLTEQILDARTAHDKYRLAEVTQQYQLAISGIAGAGAYTDFTVNFQERIMYAPLQRANKNEDPQVSHGLQLDTGDVFVTVIVKDWILDDSANYIGANVRVGVTEAAWAPGASYSGTVHLTVQGLSVPIEDPGYDDTP
jgi:hypothetical protein